MMTEDEARALLTSYVPLDHAWGAHSVTAARAAGRIAEALAAAEVAAAPALAWTGGLLHDISRGVTHDFAGHAWAGGHLVLAASQSLLARFCTTHQCGDLATEEAPLVGWPPADYRPRSWEEKAVTIADGLAYGGRVVLLADRCADVRERYRGTIDPAHSALLVGVEAKMRALMAEVKAIRKHPTEALCGAGRL